MFTVEHNVPVPRSKDTGGYPFAGMSKGDSFVIPASTTKKRITVQSAALNAARYFAKTSGGGAKFCSRTIRKGVRIWRYQ